MLHAGLICSHQQAPHIFASTYMREYEQVPGDSKDLSGCQSRLITQTEQRSPIHLPVHLPFETSFCKLELFPAYKRVSGEERRGKRTDTTVSTAQL